MLMETKNYCQLFLCITVIMVSATYYDHETNEYQLGITCLASHGRGVLIHPFSTHMIPVYLNVVKTFEPNAQK